MSSVDAFLWLNVFAGFGWFIATLNVAMKQKARFLVWMTGAGFVGVLAFHLILAAYFGSMLQPVLWTFWNAAFATSTIAVSLLVLGIRVVSNQNSADETNLDIRNKENV